MMKLSVRVAVALLCIAFGMTAVARATKHRGQWIPIGSHLIPTHVKQLIAGSGDALYAFTEDNLIYLSMDGGQNWVLKHDSLGRRRIFSLTISPQNALAAVTDSGLYITDPVSLWHKLPLPQPAWKFSGIDQVAFDSRGTMYLGSAQFGVVRLDSNGTYTQVSGFLDGYMFRAMMFDANDRLYILTDSLVRLDQSFLPDRSFGRMRGTLMRTPTGAIVASDSIYSVRGDVLSVNATPNAPGASLIVDSTGALNRFQYGTMQRSFDNGASWTTPTFYAPSIPSPGLQATRLGYAGEYEDSHFVWSRDTGSSFQTIEEFGPGLQFISIFVDRQRTIHAYDSAGGHWTSNDRGESWKLEVHRYVILPWCDQDGRFYANSWDGVEFYKVMSEDGGKTYHDCPHPNVRHATQYDFWPVESGNFYSYSNTGVMSRSTDNGATWDSLGSFADDNGDGTTTVRRCVGVVERGPYVWAATSALLHFTKNGGKFWYWDGPRQDWASSITGLIATRGESAIVSLGYTGYQWIGPNEQMSYSTWIQCGGPLVETGDSEVVGAIPWYSSPFHDDEIVNFARHLTSVDTLLNGPDTVAIRGLALDSSGDLLGIAYPINNWRVGNRGIYKFYREGASVSASRMPSEHVEITIENGAIEIRSPEAFTRVTIYDLLGRTVRQLRTRSTRESSLSVTGLPAAHYFVSVTTERGMLSSKFVLTR